MAADTGREQINALLKKQKGKTKTPKREKKETPIKSTLRAFLAKEPSYTLEPNPAGPTGNKGRPDYTLKWGPYAVDIEVKKGKGKHAVHQEAYAQKLRANGHLVVEARGCPDGILLTYENIDRSRKMVFGLKPGVPLSEFHTWLTAVIQEALNPDMQLLAALGYSRYITGQDTACL